MTTYAVIDFETTGLSPAHGARPTEIAAVLVRGGEIVDHYQSLMNAGVPVPYDIQQFTGITNEMVRQAPPVATVMSEVAAFVGACPIVCHNAAFDRKFWAHETDLLGHPAQNAFVCSLLLARRLFPQAPNHKLATLVHALGLPSSGTFHRALADAECTAHLLINLNQAICERFGLADVELELLLALQKAGKHQLDRCVSAYVGGRG
ncbi:MAG: 3'-5' exonuclease [Natronospirillum sp.]|uniref:3'-5' exonuclease n=1 Tax=Natronospirillum sp. TaxID=2812955 RepID=UPI0025CF7F4B|nr:3'-5' exonuclease [Natronospirillum sp.]MCH8552913.1 3'-5' exonuclease [Natronospirillum sp.]